MHSNENSYATNQAGDVQIKLKELAASVICLSNSVGLLKNRLQLVMSSEEPTSFKCGPSSEIRPQEKCEISRLIQEQIDVILSESRLLNSVIERVQL